jgi:alpha-D-ribose 1-methylphosphonate 5-triphosphate diphosphatase
MSLLDHSPGQRQFRDEGKLREYYRRKGAGMTDDELDVLFERRFAYQKAHAATNMRELDASPSRSPTRCRSNIAWRSTIRR